MLLIISNQMYTYLQKTNLPIVSFLNYFGGEFYSFCVLKYESTQITAHKTDTTRLLRQLGTEITKNGWVWFLCYLMK